MKTEKDFESTIEHDLVELGGYRSGMTGCHRRKWHPPLPFGPQLA